MLLTVFEVMKSVNMLKSLEFSLPLSLLLCQSGHMFPRQSDEMRHKSQVYQVLSSIE